MTYQVNRKEGKNHDLDYLIQNRNNSLNYHSVNQLFEEYNLLKCSNSSKQIECRHLNFYLNQAILSDENNPRNLDTAKKLELLILHAFSKVATVTDSRSKQLEIQTTPLLPEDQRYHRGTSNELLEKVQKTYANDFGIEVHEIQLIDSPLISEVFSREFPQNGLNLNISNKSKFKKLVNQLLENVKHGKYPETYVLIDVSKYITGNEKNLKEITQQLEIIFLDKIIEFLHKNPEIEKSDIAEKLISKLQIIAIKENILLTPVFLIEPKSSFDQEKQEILSNRQVMNKHGQFLRVLSGILKRTGFRIGPIKAKEFWLRLKSVNEIFESLDLPIPTLATQGETIPKVCSNWNDFIHQPIVSKFVALSKTDKKSPYLNVLPVATFKLLEGLKNHHVDEIFKDQGLDDILQFSYFRMLNAMNEAILRKYDPIDYYNQIEFLHQEIQNILGIIEPHDQGVLSSRVVENLTSGDQPIISADYETPKVHLKASAMRGLASIIAGVEAQKGTNHLNIVVQKNSYYNESSEVLKKAKTHSVSILDNIQNAPIDLFVCEFHHNILEKTQVYQTEKILNQIKLLVNKGLVSDKFTIIIDNTIDLERSDDLRQLLEDSMVKKMVDEGKLNVVLLRSAQKFDMLGMDNYYGGITISINNHRSFNDFNQRMNHPQDQLNGLSYQGLAHLHKYANKSIDDYRRAIMKNTDKLYKMLPDQAIFLEGTSNPMQISRIEDNKMVFLDIKFPGYPRIAEAFKSMLIKFAEEEKLPFTTRASFGFNTTNFTRIEGKKLRLNPGLDDEKTLNKYGEFFQLVQKKIDQLMENHHTMTRNEIDLIVSKSLTNT